MTKRKFYKTKIIVEIISLEPLPDTLSLEEICREANDGRHSFIWVRKPEIVLNGKQTAKNLQKQNTHPEFFSLTKNGNDVKY